MSPVGAPSPLDRGEVRSARFAARLPPGRDTAAAARRLVRRRLGRLVATRTLDDVLIVVSELVTNAVRHGRGDVELRIMFDGERVRGEVCDEGGGFTRRRRHVPSGGAGGNGLGVVEQLARTWGVHDGAAQVWFEIADPPAARSGRLS